MHPLSPTLPSHPGCRMTLGQSPLCCPVGSVGDPFKILLCVHVHPKLSHPCMATRKAIDLTGQTFVSKATSLLLNTLSRFVKAQRNSGAGMLQPVGSQRVRHDWATEPNWRFVMPFLPRSKRLLISWLQSPSTVISRYCQTFRHSKLPGVGKMGALLLSSYTLGLQYLDICLQWVLCVQSPAYHLYPFRSYSSFQLHLQSSLWHPNPLCSHQFPWIQVFSFTFGSP